MAPCCNKKTKLLTLPLSCLYPSCETVAELRPVDIRTPGESGPMMEGVLWYVLSGTRGGPNRARILKALERRPRNANQLAEDLDLDYKTVRHHLDVLLDNGVVDNTGGDYGSVYTLTDRTEQYWDTIEEIIAEIE